MGYQGRDRESITVRAPADHRQGRPLVARVVGVVVMGARGVSLSPDLDLVPSGTPSITSLLYGRTAAWFGAGLVLEDVVDNPVESPCDAVSNYLDID